MTYNDSLKPCTYIYMYTVLEATHLSANKNKFRGVYYKRVHAVYDSRIIES